MQLTTKVSLGDQTMDEAAQFAARGFTCGCPLSSYRITNIRQWFESLSIAAAWRARKATKDGLATTACRPARDRGTFAPL